MLLLPLPIVDYDWDMRRGACCWQRGCYTPLHVQQWENVQGYTIPAGGYLLIIAYLKGRRGNKVPARWLDYAAILLLLGSLFWQTLLVEGLPQIEILELSLPVPGPIRQAIEAEIQVQLQRADLLSVRFTSAEWREDEVVVRGLIR